MCETTLNPTAYGIQKAIKVEDIPKYQRFENKTVLIIKSESDICKKKPRELYQLLTSLITNFISR